MKALILGGAGQVGRALADSAPAGVDVVSYGSDTLDITDRDALNRTVAALAPDLVLNAAAYTAVDRAEEDEAAAYAVNATAVGLIADAARARGARFVHISTDFVFDGTASTPYSTDAPVNPLSAYGRTKLAGERLAGPEALIIRTAWVYAPCGSNFVHTMLRLMRERPELRVVADQIGTPTYAPVLAGALWRMAALDLRGTYHFTNAGVASWYDFAVAIQEEALAAGLLDRAASVIPIATAEFPTPARRPAYGVLDKATAYAALGGPAPHWRTSLRDMITVVATGKDKS